MESTGSPPLRRLLVRCPGDARGGKQAAHEVLINGACGTASFVDGPNDERLATATVARNKHTFHVGGKFAVLPNKGLPITTRVLRLESEHFADFNSGQRSRWRADEIRRPFLLRAFHFAKGHAAFDGLGPVDLNSFHTLDVTVAVVDKFLG